MRNEMFGRERTSRSAAIDKDATATPGNAGRSPSCRVAHVRPAFASCTSRRPVRRKSAEEQQCLFGKLVQKRCKVRKKKRDEQSSEIKSIVSSLSFTPQHMPYLLLYFYRHLWCQAHIKPKYNTVR